MTRAMLRMSHVYVMPEYVRPYQPIRHPGTTAASMILERHYDDLPIRAQEEYDNLIGDAKREEIQIRAWAKTFIAAYHAGDPLPAREFGTTIRVDTSTGKGMSDLTSMGRALYAVLSAGPSGVTSIEARKLGEVGGGISGALAKLHRAKVIVCLEQKR